MGGTPITSEALGGFYEKHTYIREATNAQQVFKSKSMEDLFNPAKIKLPREACDSVDSPRSRGIILAEDVTGSMGRHLLNLIQKQFPRLIKSTYDTVSFDPHIMFMAIGDVECDRAPLQVTQFETDLRILEQLQQIWLEEGGGSNSYESYILAWYFAAKHTRMDCLEKRGEKGFLFTFGDEEPTPNIKDSDVRQVFGDNDKLDTRILTSKDCLEMASEKFHCYHIMLDGMNYDSVELRMWKELMGGHACELKDHHYLPELVTTILAMYEGMSKTEAIARLKDAAAESVVAIALKDHEEHVEDSAIQNNSESSVEIF